MRVLIKFIVLVICSTQVHHCIANTHAGIDARVIVKVSISSLCEAKLPDYVAAASF
jgi:hypothetical protein